ncbi:hypothetical protein E8E13_009737 [Curvularia kusanoi]|uniref:F-box domain-containing protein n=1 Tax=Curvularia kusanoi TaxID=90978 RepID=A0A9P4TCX5_CURKU|nr:hypothetical protein E8E13_009737 [Curvularia kusanoi]
MFAKIRALAKPNSSRQPNISLTPYTRLDNVERSHNDVQSDSSSRLNELGSLDEIEDLDDLTDPIDLVAPMTLRKDAIAVRNQAQSPLLRLPAELRNKIYNYYPFLFLELDQLHPDYYSGEHNFFALSTVCRQLHSETALLPFSLNSLVVEARALTTDLRLPSVAQQAVVREILVRCSGEHGRWIVYDNDGFVAALEGYKGLRKVIFENDDWYDYVPCGVGHSVCRCFIKTDLKRKAQIEEMYGVQVEVEGIMN